MSQNLEAYYRDVYAPRKLLGCSESCRKKYRLHLRLLSELVERPALVSDLTEENIARLMQRHIENGRAPATVNHLRDQLMALAKFATLRGHLSQLPEVPLMRMYKRTPTAWSQEEVAAIFAAVHRVQGRVDGILARKWWAALIAVLWDCGGRIGAIMAAKSCDVDERRKTIRLRAESQKHKSDQEFLLHPETILAIKETDYKSRELLFPWTKHINMLWHDYRKILKDAGLPHGKRDLFHKMRRTVASWFEAAGGDATKLLGHSSRKVTEAYLDPTIVPRQHASELLFRPTCNPLLANGPKGVQNAHGATGGVSHERKDPERIDTGGEGRT